MPVRGDGDVGLEARAAELFIDRPPPKGSVGGYNLFWFDTRYSASKYFASGLMRASVSGVMRAGRFAPDSASRRM